MKDKTKVWVCQGCKKEFEPRVEVELANYVCDKCLEHLHDYQGEIDLDPD